MVIDSQKEQEDDAQDVASSEVDSEEIDTITEQHSKRGLDTPASHGSKEEFSPFSPHLNQPEVVKTDSSNTQMSHTHHATMFSKMRNEIMIDTNRP